MLAGRRRWPIIPVTRPFLIALLNDHAPDPQCRFVNRCIVVLQDCDARAAEPSEAYAADGMLAMGTPAKVKGPLAGTPAEFWVKANPQGYQKLAQRHLAGIAEVPR